MKFILIIMMLSLSLNATEETVASKAKALAHSATATSVYDYISDNGCDGYDTVKACIDNAVDNELLNSDAYLDSIKQQAYVNITFIYNVNVLIMILIVIVLLFMIPGAIHSVLYEMHQEVTVISSDTQQSNKTALEYLRKLSKEVTSIRENQETDALEHLPEDGEEVEVVIEGRTYSIEMDRKRMHAVAVYLIDYLSVLESDEIVLLPDRAESTIMIALAQHKRIHNV